MLEDFNIVIKRVQQLLGDLLKLPDNVQFFVIIFRKDLLLL
jgi:hypothetical protein